MRLPNTYFTKSEGGLLKALPSEDPISGIVLYNNVVPVTWATNSTGDCNWATSTAYITNDIVYDSITKLFYIALTNHTSAATFNIDLTAGLWVLKLGENIKVVRRMLDVENLGILKASTDFAVEYYHLSEFFRINSNGYLYISWNPVPSAWTFTELYNMQNEVNGVIRQVAVFINDTFATTEITALQSIADQLSDEYMPIQILYTADFSATSNITTLTTLRSLNAPKVSVVLGMDGSGEGYDLFVSKGYSIADIGAVLGAISLVKVSESIASPELINFSSAELDLPLFANGERVKDISKTDLEDLYDKGYLFFKKFRGKTGTYIVDTYTCTDELSDYSDIQLNRTIDKAIRNVRTVLLPKLHSKIATITGGIIAPIAISLFKDITSAPLLQMKAEQDIVDFRVEIDPTQNIIQTSTLYINIRVLPFGYARWISISIGYSVSL